MVIVNKEQGRQGETRNEMRWVLLISLVLAVAAMGAFLFFNTGGDEPAENASTPAEYGTGAGSANEQAIDEAGDDSGDEKAYFAA